MPQPATLTSRFIITPFVAAVPHPYTWTPSPQEVDTIFKTGERNLDATKAVLASTGLRLRADDTGGHQGRALRLYISTGAVTVSVGGGTIKEL